MQTVTIETTSIGKKNIIEKTGRREIKMHKSWENTLMDKWINTNSFTSVVLGG